MYTGSRKLTDEKQSFVRSLTEERSGIGSYDYAVKVPFGKWFLYNETLDYLCNYNKRLNG